MNAVEFLASHNTVSRRASLPHISLLHGHAVTDPGVGTLGTAGPQSARPQPVLWRGHGGRQPTVSSVEFDRQLDKVSIWLEGWDHDTVSRMCIEVVCVCVCVRVCVCA